MSSALTRMSPMQRCPCLNKGYVYFVEALFFGLWVVANVVVYSSFEPRQRGFFCNDDSIRYPKLPDTVGKELILAYTFCTPIFIMVIVELALQFKNTKFCKSSPGTSSGGGGNSGSGSGSCAQRWAWVVAAYFSYFFGFLSLTLTVSVLKLTTGQFRPHFIAVCKPDVLMQSSSSSSPLCLDHQYISEYNCTNVGMEKEIKFARQSLPSGHAANSFLTAVFMILYVERRLRTGRMHIVKLSFYAVLIVYAVWVSATRLSDNMHHFRDVVLGALLGIVFALASFFGAATLYCRKDRSDPDVESAGKHTEDEAMHNTTNHNNNRNKHHHTSDDDYDDDDVDNGNIMDFMESEAPTTPTPLLFNGVSLSSNTGLRIGPLRLEGDKHKFPRRATLQ